MITLYVLEQCKHSRNAIALLQKLGVDFVRVNIFEEHPLRLEMLQLTGSLEVPTLRSGNDFLQGFDTKLYEEFVKQHAN